MLVLPTIAQALDIYESEKQPLKEHIHLAFKDKHCLLVLDNFEQVAMAAFQVEELLAACTKLKVMITSRVVLHLQAEHEYVVEPLAIPDPKQALNPENLLQYSAIALFVQRVQALLPHFQLTPDNARAVAAICARLDGLPLAIELAAGRIKLLPPKALLKRLTQGTQLLKSEQLRPERQRTLYNTIKWSYDLLNEEEQWLFRHLSVFPTGCTLETAEVFFKESSIDILQTIASLLDKSLIKQVEQHNGMPRFMMLETVREFGLDCLQIHGEKGTCQQAHALYYLELVEQARPNLNGKQQEEWLALLEQEKENLRAGLAWLIQQKQTHLALRFCEAFGKFCGLQGYWDEEQHWFREVLNLPWTAESAAIRARVLRRAGYMAYRLRNLNQAQNLLEESISLSRSVGDQQNLAGALGSLGWVFYRLHNVASASQLLYESVKAAQQSGDSWAIANAFESLSRLMLLQGNLHEAHQYIEESLRLSYELGDTENLARILSNHSRIEIARGNIAQAMTSAQESYTLAKELGTKPLLALTLDRLGDIALLSGEYHEAAEIFEERINLGRELGDIATIAMKQLELGDIALSIGNPDLATSLVQDSLKFFWEQGDKPNIITALSLLGNIYQVEGKFQEALALYKEAFLLTKEVGHQAGVNRLFTGFANALVSQNKLEQAACLFGFAQSLLTFSSFHPTQRAAYEEAIHRTRKQLGDTAFESACSKGRHMSYDAALDFALSHISAEQALHQ